MLTVGTLGFIVFIAILSGLWHFTPPSHRWQLMLAASLVFYLSLDWQGCLLLCLMTSGRLHCICAPVPAGFTLAWRRLWSR